MPAEANRHSRVRASRSAPHTAHHARRGPRLTQVSLAAPRGVPHHPQVRDDELSSLAIIALRVLDRVHRVDLELALAVLQRPAGIAITPVYQESAAWARHVGDLPRLAARSRAREADRQLPAEWCACVCVRACFQHARWRHVEANLAVLPYRSPRVHLDRHRLSLYSLPGQRGGARATCPYPCS